MTPFRLPEVSKEMVAAGLEAMMEARADCLPDAELVAEIFLAMYGIGVYMEPETWH